MNIAYSITGNFFRELSVSIQSLSQNNDTSNINLYVLMDDAAFFHEWFPLFNDVINRANFKSCNLVKVSSYEFSDYPNLQSFSKGAYYRLLLPKLLSDCEKVIYLDADTIVEINLQELWDTLLLGHCCAGVIDTNISINPRYIKPLFNNSDGYTNSGVLLLDLNNWRKSNISLQIAECLKTEYQHIKYADQDGINKICRGRIKLLPEKWNIQLFSESICPKNGVLHYCGLRPWPEKATKYLLKTFIKYQNQTAFQFL